MRILAMTTVVLIALGFAVGMALDSGSPGQRVASQATPGDGKAKQQARVEERDIAASPSTAGKPRRFVPVAVYLDAKNEPLAAYQFRFQADPSAARIVGIEGGAHPAFHDPPYYDPEAMQSNRLIAAAFSTNDTEQLPSGKTRIATVHVAVPKDAALDVKLKLETATDEAGETIDASMTSQVKQPKGPDHE